MAIGSQKNIDGLKENGKVDKSIHHLLVLIVNPLQ